VADYSAGGLVSRLGDGEDGGGNSVGILVDEFEGDVAGDGIVFDVDEDATDHLLKLIALTLVSRRLARALLAKRGGSFRHIRWFLRYRIGGMGIDLGRRGLFGIEGNGVGWCLRYRCGWRGHCVGIICGGTCLGRLGLGGEAKDEQDHTHQEYGEGKQQRPC
jgi:hypothetical protein